MTTFIIVFDNIFDLRTFHIESCEEIVKPPTEKHIDISGTYFDITHPDILTRILIYGTTGTFINKNPTKAIVCKIIDDEFDRNIYRGFSLSELDQLTNKIFNKLQININSKQTQTPIVNHNKNKKLNYSVQSSV